MSFNPQKYSIYIVVLAIICIVLSVFAYPYFSAAEGLLYLSFLLLLSQLVLFLSTAKSRIQLLIVAGYTVTVMYFFTATINQWPSLFESIFSLKYLFCTLVFLPLFALALMHLTTKARFIASVKQNLPAYISVIGVAIIHFFVIAINTAVV